MFYVVIHIWYPFPVLSNHALQVNRLLSKDFHMEAGHIQWSRQLQKPAGHPAADTTQRGKSASNVPAHHLDSQAVQNAVDPFTLADFMTNTGTLSAVWFSLGTEAAFNSAPSGKSRFISVQIVSDKQYYPLLLIFCFVFESVSFSSDSIRAHDLWLFFVWEWYWEVAEAK